MKGMNWTLVGGWLLAVVATTAVAWQIVAVADERVGDKPLSPVEAAAPGTSDGPTTTTSPEPSAPTGFEGEPSTTTAPGSTSPTTTSGSTAPTTAATSSTTSTTPEGDWSTRTVVTSGGTVVVSYRPAEVVLETAVPLPGFQADINEPGPPVVDVELESAVVRVRVRAEWKDGDLDVEVDESARD